MPLVPPVNPEDHVEKGVKIVGRRRLPNLAQVRDLEAEAAALGTTMAKLREEFPGAREKDLPDLAFLRRQFSEQGITPPE
jgi:hypothetical protein